MNFTLLSGRGTKDLNVASNGKTATWSFAVDRPYPFNKDQDGNKVTDFFALKFIGEKSVERAKQYLGKGVKVSVRGIACRDTWKDGNDYKEYNYIIVQEWEFSESKKDGEAPAPMPDDFVSIPESDIEELPFT